MTGERCHLFTCVFLLGIHSSSGLAISRQEQPQRKSNSFTKADVRLENMRHNIMLKNITSQTQHLR